MLAMVRDMKKSPSIILKDQDAQYYDNTLNHRVYFQIYVTEYEIVYRKQVSSIMSQKFGKEKFCLLWKIETKERKLLAKSRV